MKTLWLAAASAAALLTACPAFAETEPAQPPMSQTPAKGAPAKKHHPVKKPAVKTQAAVTPSESS